MITLEQAQLMRKNGKVPSRLARLSEDIQDLFVEALKDDNTKRIYLDGREWEVEFKKKEEEDKQYFYQNEVWGFKWVG